MEAPNSGIDDLRADVRAWVDANWDARMTVRAWWELLAESGWAYPTWPKQWFGLGVSADEAAAVGQELHAAGVAMPPHSQAQTMAAPLILEYGSEEQKHRWMRTLATGAESWCQFFSEPNAGSDLASLQTRAVRDGDEWVVNGQKVWNGGANEAERGILVARTDSSLPKHRGLSFFVIDVDQPGVEIRPIRQINGDAHFNESFFSDARVADSDTIGGLNNGWLMAMATLAFERAAYAVGAHYGVGIPCGEKPGYLDMPVGEAMQRAASVRTGAPSFPMGDALAIAALAAEAGCVGDAIIRQRIAQLYMMGETARLTTLRARAAADAGKPSGAESSIAHLAGVHIARASRDLGLAILGAGGMLADADAPRGGSVTHMALTSLCHGIQGGTEHVQRNIIGERILGLPKEPQVDRDIPFRELMVGTRRAD
ncbi:MAG: acyl-CoA dehydrogenase family protein [Actinomycetota bacterium]|nr:acyl-CoA dehydrogenase family protein [Actinomycetota bacterium]